MKIRILTPELDEARAWEAALRMAEPLHDVSLDGHAMHEAELPLNGQGPDLLIVQAASESDLKALEALAEARPELDCLLIAPELDATTLLRAMRAGVREVLPAPCTPADVVQAAQRVLRKRPSGPAMHPAVATPHAEVIGFISGKGGSGATFVAANLAQLLAQDGARRVALLDLNLQFGDAALFVSTEAPASNVAEVARNIHRLDRELLQSAMTPAGPGLWVLPAPDDPAQASDVTAEHVQAMLALAVTMFDYVVIDLGRTINAVTLRAIDACQRMFVVLQQTLPFIRDAQRLRDVLRTLDYDLAKVSWIVNRHERGGDISLDDIRRTLGVTQLLTLPNQYEVVASSVNQGIPVDRLAPRSAIARALRTLAETIAPATPAPTSNRWLASLWRGASA